jgi:DNA replication protein DnaC
MSCNCLLKEAFKNGSACGNEGGICFHSIAVESRVRSANIPSDYENITVESSPVRDQQPDVYRKVDAYVKTFVRQFGPDARGEERIKSLYLYSDATGTGKTTTAAAIANEYIKRHYVGSLKRGLKAKRRPVFFLDMNELQGFYNKANRPNVPRDIAEAAARDYFEILDIAKSVDLLVIDDLGLRSASEAFRGDVHIFLNHRAANEMPTVYTSNVPLSELKTIYSKQIWDRVRDMCMEVPFEGESKRGVRR